MSLGPCIDELVEKGELSREQGKRAREIYGEAKAQRRKVMGEEAADAAASEDTLIALATAAAHERRVKLIQQRVQARRIADMAGYDGGKPGKAGAAALALLDHDGKASYANVSVDKQIIIGRVHSMIEGVLQRFKRDLLGRTPEPAELADIEREMRGESSGNASAKEMATAIDEAGEYLRRRFNSAGGAIGKLDNRGAPQHHDGVTIREAGYAPWRAFILPKLDRLKMQDAGTGLPFTDEGLERALKSVFDTVTTDGWITRDAGGAGGKRLAGTRADHRFIHFKSADDAMAYRERFGGGVDLFGAMIGEFDGLARDIAHMENLGPNPTATIRLFRDGILKEAALTGRRDTLGSSAAGDAHALEKLYDLTSGKSGIPVNAKWARGLQGARSYITAAKLGGAVFSALSDTGFQIVTRHFNGLPIWSAVSDHLQLMASGEHRTAAIRMGLIAEEAGRQAASISRYTGESVGPGVTSRMADFVLRVTGLSAWTQTGKWAYGMGQIAHLTENGHLSFDRLDTATRGSLQRYGIDGAAWDAIRAAERIDVSGADFIDPTAIKDRDAGDRLLRMLLTETAYAVPEVTARARAMTTFGRPGTLAGEAGRSALQFKSFGVSMLLTHGRRAMALKPYDALGYAAGLFVTTTLLGAVALQAKEIVKGKGLRPMEDWHFWKDAALQGSGFGIFGDFVGNALQQLDANAGIARAGSLPELLTGPLVGAAADATRLGLSPFQKYKGGYYGDHVGRELAHTLKGYTPGASIFFLRQLFEHGVVDQVQALTDPHHGESWAMMEQAAAKRGQKIWWKPGHVLPSDVPNFSAAMTAPPGYGR